VPKEFALSQNYPNPFNPTTHFSVDIPRSSAVDVTVYDVLGRKITTLMSGEQEAGYHIMEWDSKDSHGLTVPSGVYMVRMTAGDFNAVKKIMLMK
jgi:flagellar hook assembly protein FlgD